MKKFSKLNDIAFHLVNKVNKKKLKINTLILKNWEYIFGNNNKFVQLKKTIINNKTESVILELRVSPEKSFEMHSSTNEIVIKIEEVTGVKVNKILFFQDLSDKNLVNSNISNLSVKPSLSESVLFGDDPYTPWSLFIYAVVSSFMMMMEAEKTSDKQNLK